MFVFKKNIYINLKKNKFIFYHFFKGLNIFT